MKLLLLDNDQRLHNIILSLGLNVVYTGTLEEALKSAQYGTFSIILVAADVCALDEVIPLFIYSYFILP